MAGFIGGISPRTHCRPASRWLLRRAKPTRPPLSAPTERPTQPAPSEVGCAVEIRLRFRPDLRAHQPPDRPSGQVPVFKVNTAIAARDTGLIGCLRKSRPGERSVRSRRHARLYARRASRDGDRAAKIIAARIAFEDL